MTVFGNIEPSSLYIFAFNVTNADNVQAAPMISICANIDPVNTCKHAALECPTITCTVMTGSMGAQAALLVHNFFPKLRASCSAMGLTLKNINVQSFGKRRGFGMVVLNGLLTLPGSDLLFEEGVWNSELKQAVFAVAAGKTIIAGRTYALSFSVKNPVAGSFLASAISLEARGSFPAPPWTVGIARSVQSALTMPVGWRQTTIAQSSFYPDENNTLSLTLAVNVEILSGCVLTISGLQGSQTFGKDSLFIETDATTAGILARTGIWNGASGQLKLIVLSGVQMKPATPFYKISFTLQNPAVPQPAAMVSIQVDSNCSTGELPGQAFTVEDILLPIPGSKLASDTSVCDLSEPCFLDEAPLKTIAKGFALKRIGQSTHYPASLNILTLTVAVSAPISGANVYLSGLSSATFVSRDSIPLTLHSLESKGVLCPNASISLTVTLSITTVAQQSLLPHQHHVISFTVRNPSASQVSPVMGISATNRLETLTSVEVDKDTSTVLSVAG